MRILLYSDPHFCQYSSVVRMRGEKYSKRLENLIQSLNWVNQIAKEENCDKIVCLGDFFDRDDLNAEEISALSEIDLSQHFFLLGNHEMYSNEYTSNKLFNTFINTPTYWDREGILFLPYQKEENRKSIKEWKEMFGITDIYNNKLIILSHNDLKGYQYGGWISKEGYELDEIVQECSCYINGHLHNGSLVYKDESCKILNLGNLTGQNFSEDAMKYSHCVAVLDTETLDIDLIDNPYALLFFKEEVKGEKHLQEILNRINAHTETAVVTLKIKEDLVDLASAILDKCLYKRVTVDRSHPLNAKSQGLTGKQEEIDHISKFKIFVKEKYEGEVDMVILDEELVKI